MLQKHLIAIQATLVAAHSYNEQIIVPQLKLRLLSLSTIATLDQMPYDMVRGLTALLASACKTPTRYTHVVTVCDNGKHLQIFVKCQEVWKSSPLGLGKFHGKKGERED